MAAPPLVYLNGEFLPLAQARVSVMDRGFLFGDGVYEVIPAYSGRLFRVEQHLQRLTRSLREIRMRNPLSSEQWRRLLERLVGQYGEVDQSVYLQVTRGPADTRDHALPKGVQPTLFAMSQTLAPPPEALLAEGIKAVTLDDTRWRLCHIKAITLLANVLLRAEANDREAMESILIRDGKAVEGATSNLFVVRDGVLVTPPKGPSLLPGITRELVLELAAGEGMAQEEADVEEQELNIAEEIWLTSSTREVMPVTRLDGQPVGTGRPGPMWQRMHRLYQDYKAQILSAAR